MKIKMFSYKYLTDEDLKGLNKYKYSAIDTSPLSKYVMHPAWDTIVKFIPNHIAPNLLTFLGFLCMVVNVLLLSYYDYHFTAAGSPNINEKQGIPNWVLFSCGVLLFLAYNLDGIDGKQARKIGISGPLGELFDHGLDSYVVFLIPFCIISIFGRDPLYSLSVFRGYLIVLSIVLNFYVSHWEKYNTGTLYLPWGYDISMWVASLLFLVAGIKGASVFKCTFYNITFIRALELAIHTTGLLSTLPVAILNVYLLRKKGIAKKLSFLEVLRPIWSMLFMVTLITVWLLTSPTNLMEQHPRAFLLLFGTLFSNIACRLIVAELRDHRCEAICWLNWPLLAGYLLSFYHPMLEASILHALLVLSLLAHLHYGVCVTLNRNKNIIKSKHRKHNQN